MSNFAIVNGDDKNRGELAQGRAQVKMPTFNFLTGKCIFQYMPQCWENFLKSMVLNTKNLKRFTKHRAIFKFESKINKSSGKR